MIRFIILATYLLYTLLACLAVVHCRRWWVKALVTLLALAPLCGGLADFSVQLAVACVELMELGKQLLIQAIIWICLIGVILISILPGRRRW